MGFLLKFILVLLILYYGLKLGARLLLRKLVNSNPLLSELYKQQRQYEAQAREASQYGASHQYKNVEVKVKKSQETTKADNKALDDSEYIDFEEVTTQ